MTPLTEADIETLTIDLLTKQGYSYLSPAQLEQERESSADVVLRARLQRAIDKLNPTVPQDAREWALKEVLALPLENAPHTANANLASSSAAHHTANLSNLITNNETFHRMLTDGVGVEYQKAGNTVGDKVWLIDFANPLQNDLLVCNQFSVTENQQTKRPDVVLLINGLPLVVIELKNPTAQNATVEKAFTQLQNYKHAIPSLFQYNGVLVTSDGLDAKAGSLTAAQTRFMAWKTVDGNKETGRTIPQIETLINGMLAPTVLLDLIKQFTVFEKPNRTNTNTRTASIGTNTNTSTASIGTKANPQTGVTSNEPSKKIAAYHQYHAVKKAVVATKKASRATGNRKAGVVWHTQGSGKSLSMVFYAGQIVLELENPTIVVITDRNDLDDQLFETFAGNKQLLRQEPIQAKNRTHLKKLLKTAGGGIIFSTIQKFSPDNEDNQDNANNEDNQNNQNNENFELLSERKNIVVIADEAHRSQYGFAARTLIKQDRASTKYGFAKYLRDALPNASFVGFTGTPIETEDASTPAVFGNYIDVYDVQQAVSDGATVPIYYESRLARVHLPDAEKEKLDAAVDHIFENEEPAPASSTQTASQTSASQATAPSPSQASASQTAPSQATATEKDKARWTQLEAIVGHSKRLSVVAADIIEHFAIRQQTCEGKGIIVAMSRRIAVALYQEIISLRPDWHATDKNKGAIKIIMTSSSSDPQSWQQHNTSKQDRKELGERFKDPSNPLQLVIVRDMWLTGFDAPCLHSMYVDKPMRGHNLMQAIARVNRVYKDKPGGLIIDYIGIGSYLKQAMATYTKSGGQGAPTLDQSHAIAAMLEKYDVVAQMFHGFDYKRFFTANTKNKMTIILEAHEHILTLEDGKNRFTKQVGNLAKTFALSVPSRQALNIKEDLGFFQAIKTRLAKFEPYANTYANTNTSSSIKSDVEMETAIMQIVDRAVAVDGVIDIFDAAGIKKPDISILSNDFLQEVKNMKHKNVALALLQKILNDELKTRTKRNRLQCKKFSDMLAATIHKYQNNLLTTAEVIDELIQLAKKMRAADERGESLGLTENEIAFYDALAANASATEVLGDDTLRELARILVEKVKANTTIDWTIKESVRAQLRLLVKRVLRDNGYPPDEEKIATENILKQAELFASEWAA